MENGRLARVLTKHHLKYTEDSIRALENYEKKPSIPAAVEALEALARVMVTSKLAAELQEERGRRSLGSKLEQAEVGPDFFRKQILKAFEKYVEIEKICRKVSQEYKKD